jgi:hypothetical protein
MSDDAILRGWFAGRVPAGWFTGTPEITADRDEIVVIGTLDDPMADRDDADARRSAALEGRIQAFRDDTRQQRVRIADEAEARFGRKVAWGVRCGGVEVLFTSLSIPVMTRLRLPERQVLDTLVDSGVARSRSHALAWCVRLVGDHEADWIAELRDALVRVEQVREDGPATR